MERALKDVLPLVDFLEIDKARGFHFSLTVVIVCIELVMIVERLDCKVLDMIVECTLR